MPPRDSGIALVLPTIPPRAAELARCLRSVQTQSVAFDEVHVLEDLAHDGAARTLNRGLELVASPWVAFLGDDDYLLPPYVEVMSQHTRASAADVLYPAFEVTCPPNPFEWVFRQPFDGAALRDGNFIHGSAAVVRTELLRAVGGVPMREPWVPEDFALWQLLLEHGARFRMVPDVLWVWENGPVGHTRGRGDAW